MSEFIKTKFSTGSVKLNLNENNSPFSSNKIGFANTLILNMKYL